MLETVLIALGFGMSFAFGLFVVPLLKKHMPEAKTAFGQKAQMTALAIVTFVVIGLGAALIGFGLIWPIWITLVAIFAGCVLLGCYWRHKSPTTTDSR